ncbi:MAG: hypothetical protein KDC00_06180 [Flavobacteriales bacterium]|nr:hypothetical protein [Flavobacteriales bacterium]
MNNIALYLFVVLLGNSVHAQDHHPLDPEVAKTIEGTIGETYKIITGERGSTRNWEAFRQLFTPDAQMSVLVHDTAGRGQVRTFTLEAFVRNGMTYYEGNGFTESPIKTIIHEYNGIANVFQSYYAKEAELEEEGVNSFQLIFDGERWWITSILWTSNVNGVELPAELKQ